jgi:hypothetical protein
MNLWIIGADANFKGEGLQGGTVPISKNGTVTFDASNEAFINNDTNFLTAPAGISIIVLGCKKMNHHTFFNTIFCSIFVLAASFTAASGQNDPTVCRFLKGNEENSSPAISETTADPSQGAGCSDLGFCQSCCSRWTASAEFITLDRVGSVPYILMETVPSSVPYGDLPKTAGTPVFNASDFRDSFSGGPRLGLIHHGDDGSDLEASYFQIDGWDSYRAIGPTPDDWLVMRAPGNFLQTQDDYPALQQTMAWDYTSRLYNAEVNMRWHPWRSVTVLAGFRWVNLSEELEGILLPPGTDGAGTFWDTQTKNNLYGMQIGADAKLLERGRFSIDGLLKAGIFDNHVEEQTSVRMARIQFGESDSTDHLAFVGQLGVQCKCQVTRRLSFKAGYEVMWVEGVALAPGQIPVTYCHGPTTPILPQDGYVQATGVNCSSGVFYHGATAGLEFAF